MSPKARKHKSPKARKTISVKVLAALRVAGQAGIKRGDLKRLAERHGCPAPTLACALLRMRQRGEVPDTDHKADRHFLQSVQSRGAQ